MVLTAVASHDLLPAMKELNLIAHCGGRFVSHDQLHAVRTPDATATWQPIPHTDLLTMIDQRIREAGYTVIQEKHALWGNNGERYFGMLQIANGFNSDDYAQILGVRNSHDMRLSTGLVAGAGVFVCDNLSFNGEVKMVRKHTSRILDELGYLITRTIERVKERFRVQSAQFEAFKSHEINDRIAHDLMIRGFESGAFGARSLKPLIAEWRKPRHEEFKGRNLWSFFNAATEVLKGTALAEFPARTERLQALLSKEVVNRGLN
jgi:hypothetical protein